MIKFSLRNLILFELIGLLGLSLVVGTVLFVTDFNGFWRQRFSRDSAILRQIFLEHRNEILNGYTRGFEQSLSSAANVYGIRRIRAEMTNTGRTISLSRDLSAPVLEGTTRAICRRPSLISIFSEQWPCFQMNFGWDHSGGDPIIKLSWWMVPEGFAAQKRSALFLSLAVLMLGVIVCAIHWLLIRKIIVLPVANAVTRFHGWVRSENALTSPPPISQNPELQELVGHFDELLILAKDNRKMRETTIGLEARDLLARQVAHDLNSPLSALTIAIDKMSGETNANALDLAKSALERVQEIVSTLGKEKSQKILNAGNRNVEMDTEDLSSLIGALINEHSLHLESKNIHLRFNNQLSSPAFSKVNRADFCRAISNLMNNALEAVGPNCGFVEIGLERVVKEGAKFLQITIKDNGKGIPSNVLSRLGEHGVTFGKDSHKHSGMGLGVFHACNTIRAVNGQIVFRSTGENEGTTVYIELPETQRPSWWVDRITLKSAVVVLDNDLLIHRVWRQKLANHNASVHCFLNAIHMERWFNSNHAAAETLFLLDYDLGEHEPTCFDVIKQFNLPAESVIVVTARSEDPEIRKLINELGLKMLDKRRIGSTQIFGLRPQPSASATIS